MWPGTFIFFVRAIVTWLGVKLPELGVFDRMKLKSVIIPDSVTVIKEKAFAYCSSLVAVTIPSSVTVIRGEAFYQCSSLTAVSIPDSVTVIGEGAFAYCRSLAAVTIPRSVTVIEEKAFAYCSSLTAVTIPCSVTTIGKFAFEDCFSLAAVTIPESVTVIAACAFRYCGALAAVTIPSSVTTIKAGVFSYCEALTEVTIPDSVTVIQYEAFTYCEALAEVTIPDSVTKLADNAFFGCPALRAINNRRVTDLTAPNRFPVLNGISRTATVEHPLGDGDSCVVRRTWPASTTELEPEVLNEFGTFGKAAMYAGTEPGPVTEVVDATGIVSPIPLQDLGGNEYLIYGCWDADRPTDYFKALAAAQHPEALGGTNLHAWAVELPGADAVVDTLDLTAVATMLARGEVSLGEPWLLVWNEVKNNYDTGGAAPLAGNDDE